MKKIDITDIGKVRKLNQDFVFSTTEAIGSLPNLFIVADGMGGAQAGDYASRKAVEYILKYIEANKSENIHNIKLINDALQYANLTLFREANENEELSGMGTTAVIAYMENNTLYTANIGDSRLYIINEDIRQVTKDHSYVEEMVALGRMSRGSEEYKSKKNIITRAIGIDERLDIDFFEDEIIPEDILLLCSDGLSNMLSDTEILNMVKETKDIKVLAQRLLLHANENGGKDNISIILVSDLLKEGGLSL